MSKTKGNQGKANKLQKRAQKLARRDDARVEKKIAEYAAFAERMRVARGDYTYEEFVRQMRLDPTGGFGK